MALKETPVCDFGWKARPFSLDGVDGKRWSFSDVRGTGGTLVMFICNHCPYVQTIADRLSKQVAGLRAYGVGAIAVMPNDVDISPDDSFDKMKAFSEAHGFTFPYVIDRTQEVAKTYGAICTPDFFGFNARDELQYRGRLDASRTDLIPDARPELVEAMRRVAETGKGPEDQTPSMGCSIKWQAG